MWRTDWYFRGYQRIEEPKKNGKGTTCRLVYVGDWYGFPGGKDQGRAVKLKCGLLSIPMLAAYLYAQLNPVLGGSVGWLGATSMLALIPIMFEAMAFANFLPAGTKWEYRVYYSGYRRLSRFSCILEGILAIWLLMELWFVFRYPGLWKLELPYLLAIVVCLAAQTGVFVVIRKNPAQVVEKARKQESS